MPLPDVGWRTHQIQCNDNNGKDEDISPVLNNVNMFFKIFKIKHLNELE